jgi:[acyl-carrier-protein] S-malonyltransferase
VLWEPSMRELLRQGVRRFVEVGQGRVLRGLVRSVDKEAALYGSEDPESVEATVSALQEVAA